jgi:hypothetical protein
MTKTVTGLLTKTVTSSGHGSPVQRLSPIASIEPSVFPNKIAELILYGIVARVL